MCGICGIINADSSNNADNSVLHKMMGVMVHRGPDDEGMFIANNIGLGFRRLSIIDLTGGHQPMSNEDGSVWIVFNGEFYNHSDIRSELESKGHIYKTRADTETLIHLYEEEGIDGLQRVVGMYAFAIWDGRENRLVIGRDRLGIKPLHYHFKHGNLVFASEIKSLLQHPEIRPELNENGLEEQLIFRYMAGEESLFKSIKKLLPGHVLIWQDGEIKVSSYWNPTIPDEFISADEASAMSSLEELLEGSVRMRLMSDVPLGTFCSGGVDSGLTTAFAKRHADAELNTFSIGFYEKEWDESAYAQMVSDKYETRHHIIRIDRKQYADSIPELIWYHDEPLYHPSSSLVYFVSKLAREHVTVVLTGEGADELFGGYPRFLIPREYSRLSGMPVFMRKLARSMIGLLSSRKLDKLGYFLPLSPREVAVYNSQYALPRDVKPLISGDINGNSIDYRFSLLDKPDLTPKNLPAYTMFLDLKTYIPAALHRQDKMSMANSLESRVPFLDHRLVEWALTVPQALKIKGTKNKYILKKLGERMLPRQAIYRQKVGFGVPVVDWLRDPEGLGRYLELLSEPRFRQRGFVDPKQSDKLVADHLAGKKNNCEILWNLINLELWYRIFIDNSLVPNSSTVAATEQPGS